MEKLTPNLTDSMDGFIQEKVDFKKYETSFRRWLVCEIESGRMGLQEAKSRFKLPYYFEGVYRNRWLPKYADEIVLTLPLMSAKERTDNQALEKRIKELEKQLEYAQMKIVAMNTVIDIAEKDYKLDIRKKYGPKQ